MDPEHREQKWKATEAELHRIASKAPLDRQLLGNREVGWLGEQDAIEFQLGSEGTGLRARWPSFDRRGFDHLRRRGGTAPMPSGGLG